MCINGMDMYRSKIELVGIDRSQIGTEVLRCAINEARERERERQ